MFFHLFWRLTVNPIVVNSFIHLSKAIVATESSHHIDNLKGTQKLVIRKNSHSCNFGQAYVVVQFYPCFEFYFSLFQIHYHTLPYPKTKENKI